MSKGVIQPPKPQNNSGQYFQERRKGEMNELKNLLNKAINDQDGKKARDIVKKVIGYMTLGMDASPVFSEMCRTTFISDQITKKMIYFYLTTYAEDNPDLAIMAVNTFQKDCKHASSKVRGLALRNLCSFKPADYVNNVLPTIRELLSDFQPYVKKTAIMGVLKVFYYDPPTIFRTLYFIVDDENIIATLSSHIRDNDPLVSVNAVLALQEIFISEGGIPLSPKLVKYLYKRLKEYSGWAQSQILEILYKYDPKDEKEHYQIMSNLWEKLKQSSTSLVLSSIRIIIKLAKNKPELFNNVVQKIKAPLLTLMSTNQMSGSYESIYVILQHIEYVICHMDGKKFYEKDFKYFYCRIYEPTYSKLLKVKILGELANQYNLGDMLNQLNEYATDNDIEIARKAIQVISDIAISLPEVSKALLVNLIAFYKSEKPHLSNASMIAFSKVLKKYPKLFSDLQPVLLAIDKSIINEPESINSFIWILGNFGNQIEAAPYILEEYLEDEAAFEKWPETIKSIFLTHMVQIFVKRPPQVFKMLAKTFRLIMNSDSSSMLLKDHATFYYRALKDNAEEVKKGFSAIESEYSKSIKQKNRLSAMLASNIKSNENGTNAAISVSSEDVFNNLSLVYRKKEHKFIKNYNYFITMRNKELGLIQANYEEQQQEEEQPDNNEGQVNSKSSQNLPDLTEPIEAGDLQQSYTMTAQEFEETWNSLEHHEEREFKSDNEDYLSEESVEELFKMWMLYCMASASQDDEALLKFFIYGCHNTGNVFCLELTIEKGERKITLLTKAKTDKIAGFVNDYIKSFLQVNEFIV